MREIVAQQRPLRPRDLDHDHARELKSMSEILDELPAKFLALVHGDLVSNGRSPLKGRKAMTAEPVLRAIIIKQMNGYTYRKLSFHLQDSNTYQAFCRLTPGKAPKKAALQANFKRVKPETMEQVNRAILERAMAWRARSLTSSYCAMRFCFLVGVIGVSGFGRIGCSGSGPAG